MRAALLNAFREAAWLDAVRARAWRDILLAMSLLAAGAWIALARGGLDLTGKPLGTDFLSFYAASRLALSGDPAGAYEVARHRAAEVAVFGRDVGYAAFFYPPLFLAICAPLAILPYLAALAAWLSATGALFAGAVRGWLDRRLGWRTLAAFPAVLMNLGHGQNAFLSAGLLAAGALWLESRPILAGVAFGLLAFKPHLGLLLPLAFLARGRWRTFAAAAATVAALALASLGLFGAQTWQAFLANSALARATLEQGLVEPGKMASAFAAVRVLGGPLALAYLVQAAVSLAVAGGLVAVLRRRPGVRAEGALIVLAAVLGSPFLLDYDLVILAVPLAWLAGEGIAKGFRPWEKILLLAGFLLPVTARALAMRAHLPLAPLVLLALFALIARRAGETAALVPGAAAGEKAPCPSATSSSPALRPRPSATS